MRSSVIGVALIALVAVIVSPVVVTDKAAAISLPRTMSDGRVCRMLLGAAHMHSGHSGRTKAYATKEMAQHAAIMRWSRFTAWEYGPEWGDFRVAARRTARCTPGTRGGWKCKVEAQPCRH